MYIAGICSYQTGVRTRVCYCIYNAAKGRLTTPWMGIFTYAISFRQTASLSLIVPILLSGGPYEGIPFRPTILDAVRDLGEWAGRSFGRP